MPSEYVTFYFPWEMELLQWFQSLHNPILDKIELATTMLAEKGIFWIVLSLLLFLFVKDKRPGLSCIGALCLSVLLCNIILKNILMRGRPCWEDPTIPLLVAVPDDFSFPSGHTSFSFACATAVFRYYKGWGLLALLVAVLIGVSRLYLFVHWPTDVLCGALVGIIAGVLSSMLVRDFYRAHPHFKGAPQRH